VDINQLPTKEKSMSQAAAAVQNLPASIKPGQVLIAGKIHLVRKSGSKFVHLIVMPATDAYSSPSTVEISASSKLGDKEEDCKVLCRVTGYRRSYKTTDQETGEQKTVFTADNRLFAVED
jgi:hypothetical protein